MVWALMQAAVPVGEGVTSSVVIIMATVAIAVSKGYLNRQFSGVHNRINGVEQEIAGLRVGMAAMDERVMNIPSDTALQISESYAKGAMASRAAFVAIGECQQRERDVERRLNRLENRNGPA